MAFDIIIFTKGDITMKSKSKSKKKAPYIPRIIVKMNTGTRVMKTKKDKAMKRQKLNKDINKLWR